MLTRRGLITGLVALTATAPAIVRAASLMPVKATPPLVEWPPEPCYVFPNRMIFVQQGTHVRWSSSEDGWGELKVPDGIRVERYPVDLPW